MAFQWCLGSGVGGQVSLTGGAPGGGHGLDVFAEEAAAEAGIFVC